MPDDTIKLLVDTLQCLLSLPTVPYTDREVIDASQKRQIARAVLEKVLTESEDE